MHKQNGCWCMGVGSVLDPSSYFLSSLPKASIPSLSSSLYSPLCPTFAIYCLWLSASVAFLVTRTQQSGLSTKGPGQRPSWHSSYCLPSGYSCSEGRGLPKHKGCCHLRDDSALGSRWLLSVFSPRLLSPISPQVPPAHSALTFGRAQGKCLQMKICFLAL